MSGRARSRGRGWPGRQAAETTFDTAGRAVGSASPEIERQILHVPLGFSFVTISLQIEALLRLHNRRGK